MFALLGLAGCAPPETNGGYGATDLFFIPGNYVAAYDSRLPGRIDEVIVALREAGFMGEDIDKFICLANGESGMGEAKFNGSCCHGLFQIHNVHNGKTCPAWNTNNRSDPKSIYNFKFNAACAFKVYGPKKNIGAWESWKRHCGSGASVINLGARRNVGVPADPKPTNPGAQNTCGPIAARGQVGAGGRPVFELQAPGARTFGIWDGLGAYGGPAPPEGGKARLPMMATSCKTYFIFAFNSSAMSKETLCGSTKTQVGPGC